MPISLEPVSGKDVKHLQGLLQDQYFEFFDLDMAMVMNVPPMRINEVKKALPGTTPVDSGAHEDDDEADEIDHKDTKRRRRIKPYQAILVRLLKKHPEYTPIIPKPSSVEVWEAIAPYMPKPARPSREANHANRRGFGPLFGRSNVSSYKLLDESSPFEAKVAKQPGGSVSRLYMLVLGKLGQIFRDNFFATLDRTAPASVIREVKRQVPRDWTILHQEESLITTYIPGSEIQNFRQELSDQRRAWFDLYMNVLHDEAVSRRLEPDVAIAKGNWTKNDVVTSAELRAYEPRQRPILGKGSQELDGFKERFDLTSSEFFWTLGLQIRAYYRIRSEENENRRIDPATSILLRYLWRYPKDIHVLLYRVATAEELLEKITAIDPEFKVSQLGPLFGGAYVASYYFARSNTPPYFARRMSSIMGEYLDTHPEIYTQVRECAEEEAYARGVRPETLWKEGRWSTAS